jgi:hypothetical protein
MKWFIGRTGYSLLDVWTLVHLAFWFFAGSIVWSLRWNRAWGMAACMAVAVAWEVFERFAEKRWPNLWLNPESWWNAWVSDLFMCAFGVALALWALDHWRHP